MPPAMFWESLSATGPLSGQTRLSSGCLVLRANTQENPGGKNRVMTQPTQLDSRKKNPITQIKLKPNMQHVHLSPPSSSF